MYIVGTIRLSYYSCCFLSYMYIIWCSIQLIIYCMIKRWDENGTNILSLFFAFSPSSTVDCYRSRYWYVQ